MIPGPSGPDKTPFRHAPAQGSAYALVANRCATCGKIKICVDGKHTATVDTVAKSTAVRQVVWSTEFGTIGKHTVKIVVVGTSGR